MKRRKITGIAAIMMAIVLLTGVLLPVSVQEESSAAVTGINPVEVHVGLTVTDRYTTQTKNPIVLAPQDPSVLAVSAGAASIVTGGACQIYYDFTGLKAGKTILSVYSEGVLMGTVDATVTDHVWNTEPTVDVEPTCTSEGSQSIHCSCEGCTAIKPGSEQKVPMIPHTWKQEYTVDDEPTYFTVGHESHHCSVCDAIDEASVRTIPKLKLGRAKIKKIKNNKADTIVVTMKMMEGPSGFKFSYATNLNFLGAKTLYTKNTHVKIQNLHVGRTYYFRARPVLKEDGNKAYGKWSKKKAFRVKR